jgi:hypothetical protein
MTFLRKLIGLAVCLSGAHLTLSGGGRAHDATEVEETARRVGKGFTPPA